MNNKDIRHGILSQGQDPAGLAEVDLRTDRALSSSAGKLCAYYHNEPFNRASWSMPDYLDNS